MGQLGKSLGNCDKLEILNEVFRGRRIVYDIPFPKKSVGEGGGVGFLDQNGC